MKIVLPVECGDADRDKGEQTHGNGFQKNNIKAPSVEDIKDLYLVRRGITIINLS
jgi:hypothetical protein